MTNLNQFKNAISSKTIIKNVTFVTTKEGKELVILHTTPSKELKDANGNPLVRFKMARKVFAQRAKELGVPEIIYKSQVIGATYTHNVVPVKAGDAWIDGGNGIYTKDHNAKHSEEIALSALAVAQFQQTMLSAFAASQFAAPQPSIIAQPVAITSSTTEEDGDDLPA